MSTPGYGCEFCQGARPVNWLITHLNPAGTISVCDEDFPVAMISLLAGELGVDPGQFYEVVSAYVNDQVTAAAEAEATGPTKQPDTESGSGAADADGSDQPAPTPGRAGTTARSTTKARSAARK